MNEAASASSYRGRSAKPCEVCLMEKKRYIAPKTSRALMLGAGLPAAVGRLGAGVHDPAGAATRAGRAPGRGDRDRDRRRRSGRRGTRRQAARPRRDRLLRLRGAGRCRNGRRGHPGILFLPLPGLPRQPAVVPRPVPCALPALREAALKVKDVYSRPPGLSGGRLICILCQLCSLCAYFGRFAFGSLAVTKS